MGRLCYLTERWEHITNFFQFFYFNIYLSSSVKRENISTPNSILNLRFLPPSGISLASQEPQPSRRQESRGRQALRVEQHARVPGGRVQSRGRKVRRPLRRAVLFRRRVHQVPGRRRVVACRRITRPPAPSPAARAAAAAVRRVPRGAVAVQGVVVDRSVNTQSHAVFVDDGSSDGVGVYG